MHGQRRGSADAATGLSGLVMLVVVMLVVVMLQLERRMFAIRARRRSRFAIAVGCANTDAAATSAIPAGSASGIALGEGGGR
ncbi:hypothetical protein BURKHO8Y_480075 [Burkholderia sp. 8Y]|nr:hypothetical protein BURKHO8Y_480075 [Burkholderia sp. 8Y]